MGSSQRGLPPRVSTRRSLRAPLLHLMPVEMFDTIHTPLVRAPAPRRQSGGFIVLGLLIAITGAMVAGVLIGKIVHASRYPYVVPLGSREMVRLSDPLEVRYGALVTARVSAGEVVWIRPVGDGKVAVFAGAESSRVVGFVTESELRGSAGQAVQLR
jgi:hypothetical protein